jgi:hypothetical protein
MGTALHRTAGIGVSLVLLGSLAAATPVAAAAASDCTYTFPPEGRIYKRTVVAGEVLCGGPGQDRVLRMEGGKFRGDGGRDIVDELVGGTFAGGRWRDEVRVMSGGLFKGGRTYDFVEEFQAGTFRGGRGGDEVDFMMGGEFIGGGGTDHVYALGAGTFRGESGNDEVGEIYSGTFDGGGGTDSIYYCYTGPPAVIVNVEAITDERCDLS